VTRSITYGLDPFRKNPADLVQTLPGKRPNTMIMGHVLAIIVGAVVAVLWLAAEGSL
jgi:hypothetical protein